MKKLITLMLALVLCLLTGCNGEKQTAISGEAQYVLALNPSVENEDGTVISLRNSAASSMKVDLSANAGNTDLYKNTPWKWVYKDEGEWNTRYVRGISNWANGSGIANKQAPYSYLLADNGTNSLSVYDSAKMKIKGENLGESGIIATFTGSAEQGIYYFAEEDCLINIGDRNGGNISVVNSIYGANTSFLNNKNAKKAVITRIYINNRIYWQDVIDKDNTSVEFPSFSSLELNQGDCIMITFEPTNDASSIVKGNCDLEDPTKIIQVKVPTTSEVLVEKPITNIPLVVDTVANFSIVIPNDATDETQMVTENFKTKLSKKLDSDIDIINEKDYKEGYAIFVSKCSNAESANALSSIKSTRKNYDGDFIIRQVGDKIIISADNDYSLEYAFDFFVNNYVVDEDTTIPVGLEYISSKYNSIKKIMLGGKPISEYKIVLANLSTFIEKQAAEYLQNFVIKNSGKKLEVISDKVAQKGLEILIGATNRTSNNYTLATTNSLDDNYEINVTANYTSVLSTSNSAVNAGVIELVNKLSSGSLKVGKYTGKYDGGYSLTNGWKLAWSEDFSGDALTKTWVGKGDMWDEDTTHGGKSIGDPTLASVDNGVLVGKSHRNEYGDVYALGIETAGANSMRFKYGYVEGRMKLPARTGWMMAFWLNSASGAMGSAEYDIFENAGSVNTISPNLHMWRTEANGGHVNMLAGTDDVANHGAPKYKVDEEWSERYHTFGMEWNNDQIKFYCDGIFYCSVDLTEKDDYEIFDQYCSIVLHVDGDLKWTNRPVADDDTASFGYVDWVRVWQKDEEGYGILIK